MAPIWKDLSSFDKDEAEGRLESLAGSVVCVLGGVAESTTWCSVAKSRVPTFVRSIMPVHVGIGGATFVCGGGTCSTACVLCGVMGDGTCASSASSWASETCGGVFRRVSTNARSKQSGLPSPPSRGGLLCECHRRIVLDKCWLVSVTFCTVVGPGWWDAVGGCSNCHSLLRRRLRRVGGCGAPLVRKSWIAGFNNSTIFVANSSGTSFTATCLCWQPLCTHFPRIKL